jgi:hypothetical protein
MTEGIISVGRAKGSFMGMQRDSHVANVTYAFFMAQPRKKEPAHAGW